MQSAQPDHAAGTASSGSGSGLRSSSAVPDRPKAGGPSPPRGKATLSRVESLRGRLRAAGGSEGGDSRVTQSDGFSKYRAFWGARIRSLVAKLAADCYLMLEGDNGGQAK